MRIIAAVILYILFFCLCFLGTGNEEKNIRSFYSYPDQIQEKIKESGRFRIPKKQPYLLVFFSNTMIFTIVFLIIGLILKETSFWYFLITGEGLNLFDLLIIDLSWWQHSKRIQFSGIGEAKDYHGCRKHIGSFLRAIPVFAAAAGLASGILINLL